MARLRFDLGPLPLYRVERSIRYGRRECSGIDQRIQLTTLRFQPGKARDCSGMALGLPCGPKSAEFVLDGLLRQRYGLVGQYLRLDLGEDAGAPWPYGPRVPCSRTRKPAVLVTGAAVLTLVDGRETAAAVRAHK